MNHYDKNGRCKICRSELCNDIDSYLESGKTYQSIANWANGEDEHLKLTKKNISGHNTEHRMQDPQASPPPGRGRKKGYKNEVPIKGTKKRKKAAKKKVVKKTAPKNTEKPDDIKTAPINDITMQEASTYLDSLLSKANQQLQEPNSRVTITEALKAIELKHKMSKGSPFEDVLVDFIERVVDSGLPS